MKRIVAILLTFTMVISTAACGSGNHNNTSLQNQSSSSTAVDFDSQGKGNAEASSPNDGAQKESDLEEHTWNSGSEQGSNILVAYFSRVGNTEWEEGVDVVTSASLNVENGMYVGNAQYLARMAQQVTGGDIFLIQTEETYPSDYRETTDLATEEQNSNARPALVSHVENMDQYDTIVLIYPKMEYGFDCVLCA